MHHGIYEIRPFGSTIVKKNRWPAFPRLTQYVTPYTMIYPRLRYAANSMLLLYSSCYFHRRPYAKWNHRGMWCFHECSTISWGTKEYHATGPGSYKHRENKYANSYLLSSCLFLVFFFLLCYLVTFFLSVTQEWLFCYYKTVPTKACAAVVPACLSECTWITVLNLQNGVFLHSVTQTSRNWKSAEFYQWESNLFLVTSIRFMWQTFPILLIIKDRNVHSCNDILLG